MSYVSFQPQVSTLFLTTILKSKSKLPYNILYMAKVHSKIQGDHSTCAKPPVDFKTKVPLWPVQARTGQAKAQLLS